MKEENRIRNDLNNDTNYWWLRSAIIYYYDSVACVYDGGDVRYNGYYNGFGVVPAFII